LTGANHLLLLLVIPTYLSKIIGYHSLCSVLLVWNKKKSGKNCCSSFSQWNTCKCHYISIRWCVEIQYAKATVKNIPMSFLLSTPLSICPAPVYPVWSTTN